MLSNNDLVKIRKWMFSETEFPFPSNQIYSILGYTRHNNFTRVLKSDEGASGFIIKYARLKERETQVYFLSRGLFLDICQRICADPSAISDFFVEYNVFRMKSEILFFINHKKYEYVPHVCKKIRGRFYNYSLTTLNISKTLQIDPFDLFKFCSQELSSYKDYAIPCFTNRFEKGTIKPFFSFDSVNHITRYGFFLLLNDISNKYKLTQTQLLTLYTYASLIKEMLEKQVEYDFQEKLRTDKKNKKNQGATRQDLPTAQEKVELKRFYRKAAHLCHPDKNKNRKEIFQKLNAANRSGNLKEVKKIYMNLTH